MSAVAVTARSFRQVPGEHQELLRASGLPVRFAEADHPLDEEELVELVRGCWGLIVGVDPVTAAVLDAGPLRVVVRFGSGTDNVDLEAAGRRGVRVAATPGANARSVAELTIGLLLALARHLVVHDREIRSGSWSRHTGIELAGRRLGVVGYGVVGRQVAGIAGALGMEVVATDPAVRDADVPLVDLETMLASSDAVTLHVPLADDTRAMIGATQLDRMRPQALLVNTSRGGLVDERALAQALAAGRLGGAAFDTFEHEPPEASPLLALDTFIASPHAGAATVEAARRTGVAAVRELLAGRPSGP
ncbi:MAG TPA: phosphoglycerate dehydrogenase [Actinomycetes bacterium]|nr:phosphoglycerate dehydrogenase [Actinomycetes bacterium]